MSTDLEQIEKRLRAIETALGGLGVNLANSLDHVRTTPAMTCMSNGVALEAILRDLWQRLGIKGHAGKKQLEDLLSTVGRKLEDDGRPFPRPIFRYMREIQSTRNDAVHHLDVTEADAIESLRHLSEIVHWYFVQFLGHKPEEADAGAKASVELVRAADSPQRVVAAKEDQSKVATTPNDPASEATGSFVVVEHGGDRHELSSLSIAYPSGLGPSREKRGIKLCQGSAETLIEWSRIHTLILSPAKTQRGNKTCYPVQVRLRDGTEFSRQIAIDAHMSDAYGYLFGQHALGEVRLHFSQIARIMCAEAAASSEDVCEGRSAAHSDAQETEPAVKPVGPATGDVPLKPAVPPAPPSVEVRIAVERALKDMNAEWVHGGMFGPGGLADKNSLPVWRELYHAHKGEAILEICRFLTDSKPDSTTCWKAIKLLSYGLRVPEGRPLVPQIVDAVCRHLGGAHHVQAIALTIFDEVVLPKKDKWERLFAVLSTSQFQNAEPVATRLVQCTAPDDRERAARCILEAVKCVTGGTSLIGPLERLDCRSLIPKMRELLFAAPTHTAGDLAILLAKWKDSASAPAIRELIQYQGERLSRLPEVLLGLYELEGAPSAECLAECIRLLPPASKKWVLTQWNGDPHCRVAIRAIAELPLRNLLRELAGETEDPEVKKAATALLAKAEGQT